MVCCDDELDSRVMTSAVGEPELLVCCPFDELTPLVFEAGDAVMGLSVGRIVSAIQRNQTHIHAHIHTHSHTHKHTRTHIIFLLNTHTHPCKPIMEHDSSTLALGDLKHSDRTKSMTSS